MQSAGKRGRRDEESSSSVSSDEEPSSSNTRRAAVTRSNAAHITSPSHIAASAASAAMNPSSSFTSVLTSPLSRLHEAKRNSKHKRQLTRGAGGRFRSKVDEGQSSSQQSSEEEEEEEEQPQPVPPPRGRGRPPNRRTHTDSSSIPIDTANTVTIGGSGDVVATKRTTAAAARAAATATTAAAVARSESDGSEDDNPRKRQRVTRSSGDHQPHPSAAAASSSSPPAVAAAAAAIEETKEVDEEGAEEEDGEEEEDEEDEEQEDEAMQDEKKSVAMEEATTSAKSKPAQRRRRRRKAPLGLKRRKNINRSASGVVESDESDTGAAAANRSVVLPRFRCVNRVREGHGNPLYFVAFNCVDARHADVFASAGANRVTVYRALAGGAVDPMQLYVDEDPREYIYALAWSIDLRTGSALLLMAGQNGIIKIIDCHTRRLVRRLLGHGSSINELKLHPHDLNILLSVSKDMSVRLWNIQSGDCIAIFAGEQGHRDEVLSADFHQSGERIVSSGMDHAIMIWEIDARIKQAMKQSYAPSHLRPTGEPFSTVFVQFPLFSTNQVHQNYVDHVKFFGDFILSKSTEEKIVMWKVRNEAKRKAPHRLMEYTFSDCDIWYIRFAMDMPNLQYIAVGNKSGAIFVWSADEVPPCAPRKLVTPQSQRAIRCVAFSSDAKILIAACEDGSLFRWDQLPPTKNTDIQGQEKLQQSMLDEAQQMLQGRQESGSSM